MDEQAVTPIRRKATPRRPPRLLLVECPDETVHRVACVLKYLATHPRDNNFTADPDEEFALFMILRDLSEALEYSLEVDRGQR